MAYTPIAPGSADWDVPVNAAFTSQDSRITVNEGQIAANSAAITLINAKTLFVRKTADETVTNSVAYQSDDELFLSVVAGRIYKVEGYIAYNTPASTGINLRMTGPTGTGNWNFLSLSGGGTTDTGQVRMSTSPNGTGTARTTSAAAVDIAAYIRGTFAPTVSGTLQFEWTQNAANASPTTVRANSWLELTRVN